MALYGCEGKMEEGRRREAVNIAKYRLDTIPALPRITKKSVAYWAKLAEDYPENPNSFFLSKYRKLQMKVVDKFIETNAGINVLYDNTDEPFLTHIIHACVSRICIKVTNVKLGDPRNFGRLDEFMGDHRVAVIYLFTDEAVDKSKGLFLNALNFIHAVTICRTSEDGKPPEYRFFDSMGTNMIHLYSKGIVNLLHFAGNAIARDQSPENIRALRGEIIRLSKARTPFSSYIDEVNIKPFLCNTSQTRPSCTFWSLMRTLHPEKSGMELQCYIDTLVLQSGVDEYTSTLNRHNLTAHLNIQHIQRELLIIHILQEYTTMQRNTRNQRTKQNNRWGVIRANLPPGGGGGGGGGASPPGTPPPPARDAGGGGGGDEEDASLDEAIRRSLATAARDSRRGAAARGGGGGGGGNAHQDPEIAEAIRRSLINTAATATAGDCRSGQWQCNVCTACNPNSVTICQVCGIAKERPPPGECAPDQWKCLVCTLCNSNNDRICLACSTPRGTVPAKGGRQSRYKTTRRNKKNKKTRKYRH